MELNFDAMMAKQKEGALDPNAYTAKPKFERDERFYTISKDKDGNGKVKIRFMPSVNGDKTQFVQWITQQVHNVNWFKNPLDEKSEKRWWSGVCPKTKGSKEDCPICQYGFDQGGAIDKLSGDEHKNDPQQILRSKYYREFVSSDKMITNIMVVKDEQNPENEGKIFLYELKSSVFKMFAAESERVLNELSECDSPQDRQARNIPDSLEGFDAYDLMCGKDLWLIYKDKKNHPDKDPKHYWGNSYWDSIFTDKVQGNKELYMELVQKAYCLDEFITDEAIPAQEFLEEKLAHLTFAPKDGVSKPALVITPEVKAALNAAEDLLASMQDSEPVAPVVQEQVVAPVVTPEQVVAPVTPEQVVAPVTPEPVVQESTAAETPEEIIARLMKG